MTLHKEIPFIYLVTFSLLGCGGGGSESTSVDISHIDKHANTLTKQLSAEPYFEMKTSHTLTIDFSWAELSEQRAYLSICQQAPAHETIDYTNCLLRTPINNGEFQGTIVVTNDQRKLFAEVWRYDLTSQPISQKYEIEQYSQQRWEWYQ
ncbi:hypothetical protein ACFL2V_01870 [Pseudomonadota bacterium]